MTARAAKQSFQHICLEVDDVAKTVVELRGRGIEITEAKLGLDQSWQAWLSDPDGNRIELPRLHAEKLADATSGLKAPLFTSGRTRVPPLAGRFTSFSPSRQERPA